MGVLYAVRLRADHSKHSPASPRLSSVRSCSEPFDVLIKGEIVLQRGGSHTGWPGEK